MKNVLCCLSILFSLSLSAQYDHEAVFPDLEGSALRAALIADFKTSTVLDYGDARDTFFSKIDAVDNVLECVYTGFQIVLNPNLDPTTDAFDQGINTEHTYPRSKGASENTRAYSDMHHLFPAREKVNTDRGVLPFFDIVDSQTDTWYFEDQETSFVPGQNIDSYSEILVNEAFEPREQHKGDVARAYFYFYTMYKAQADIEDPDYFESQRETMCTWHFQDPVDQKEWNRNIKIASYQGDKRNPFILDCRLARLYCDEIMGTCSTVATSEKEQSRFSIQPNPAVESIVLSLDTNETTRYEIHAATGQKVLQGYIENGELGVSISIENLNRGFYWVRVFDEQRRLLGVTKFPKI